MTTSLDLLREIETGARAIGIAPTTLCQKAVLNGALIDRLRNGGSVTLETAHRIREFIEANLPPLDETPTTDVPDPPSAQPERQAS